MDWDTFTQRWNDRRLRREAARLQREERVAFVVLACSILIAGFIVIQCVWGFMA